MQLPKLYRSYAEVAEVVPFPLYFRYISAIADNENAND
jgi:hypothetical protein